MNPTTIQLNPYLNFSGQCEEAFGFYEKTFGGQIESMMTYEKMPAEYRVADDWRKKILHATLLVRNQVLMGADAPPDRYVKPQGFSVTIGLTDEKEAERIFAALAEQGSVLMALQPTFWASRFGMVTDRFGIPWMINCGKGAA